MWMFSRRIREVLLLTKANEILGSVAAVDVKVATVQQSLDALFKDLVSEVEVLRIDLARANTEIAVKQAKIDELNGVIGGALQLARRCSLDR